MISSDSISDRFLFLNSDTVQPRSIVTSTSSGSTTTIREKTLRFQHNISIQHTGFHPKHCDTRCLVLQCVLRETTIGATSFRSIEPAAEFLQIEHLVHINVITICNQGRLLPKIPDGRKPIFTFLGRKKNAIWCRNEQRSRNYIYIRPLYLFFIKNSQQL